MQKEWKDLEKVFYFQDDFDVPKIISHEIICKLYNNSFIDYFEINIIKDVIGKKFSAKHNEGCKSICQSL